MLGALIPCGGGDSIPLAKTRIVVGRERPCDVVLRHKNVSSRHCELELMDGYWFVRDLNSTNGIRVNGVPCDSKYLLPRDVLTIASHRFSVVYTPPSDRPPPEPDRPMHLLDVSLMERAGLASATQKSADTETEDEPTSAHDLGASSESRSLVLGALAPRGGGEVIPLLKPKLVIGRSGRCDIVLRFSTVSARHCELEFSAGHWHVRDLGSRNGIKVDGVPCQVKWLKPHSILSIAEHRYEVAYSSSGQEPPPKDEASLTRSLLEKAGLNRRKT